MRLPQPEGRRLRSTTGWNSEPWHNVLASYIPVKAFDPATPDCYQSGAMIYEGIHAIFANEIGTAQTVDIPDATTATISGTPTSPTWLTFEFDSPVSLNENTQYAYAFLST